MNENIYFKKFFLIGPKGEKLGIFNKINAIKEAKKYNLDLFCVSPNSNPVVCKILDYGRFFFKQQKKFKKNKKNFKKKIQKKMIRLTPVIDKHDFNTKLNYVKKWLKNGYKIKIIMCLKGRFITKVKICKKIIEEFLIKISKISVIEKKIKLEGNFLSVIIFSNYNIKKNINKKRK